MLNSSKHFCQNRIIKLSFSALIFSFFLLSYSTSAKAVVIYELFNNYNIAAVFNGPTQPTTFTIDRSYEITEIETYHWNSQRGQTPGQIRLVHQDGTVYGPWQATGRKGQWEVPNAYWQVNPFVTVKPGTYTIKVSSPETWSYNSGSGNAGHAKVMGILASQQPYSDSDIIFNFIEDYDFGAPIFVPKRQQTQCIYDYEGNPLCYRQYDLGGAPIYLATYVGFFWLYEGVWYNFGTVSDWLIIAGHSPSPAALVKAESISTDPSPVSQISITPYGMFDFIYEGPFTVDYIITNTGNSEATKTVTANAFVSLDFGETGHLIGGVHQQTITVMPGQSMRLTRSFNAVAGGLWTFSLDTEDDSLDYQLLVMESEGW